MKSNLGPKDFTFSPDGIIFKANLLIYKQDKLYKDRKDPTAKNVTYGHFLTLKGFKMLVVDDLKSAVLDIFFKPFEKVREKFRSRPRKKQDSSDDEEKQPGGLEQRFTNPDCNFFYKEDDKSRTRRDYNIGVLIETPQFNFNDHVNKFQMLFASHGECMISVCREILPFDRFQQDLRTITKISFAELELYTIPDSIDPRKKIYWLEDTRIKLNLNLSSGLGPEQTYR